MVSLERLFIVISIEAFIGILVAAFVGKLVIILIEALICTLVGILIWTFVDSFAEASILILVVGIVVFSIVWLPEGIFVGVFIAIEDIEMQFSFIKI